MFGLISATPDELKILEVENRKDTMTSFSFYMTVLTTGVLALTSPFFKAFYRYLKGDNYWDALETPLKGR